MPKSAYRAPMTHPKLIHCLAVLTCMVSLISCRTTTELPAPVYLADVVQSAPADDDARIRPMASVLNSALADRMESQPTQLNRQLFALWTPGEIIRSTGWLSAFDFSGVAFDDARTCTLVHPQAVLMARHYQRPVGASVTFHASGGWPVVRTIVDVVQPVTSADVTLAWLDSPAHGCAVYPVLPDVYDWGAALRHVYALVTNRRREVLLYKCTDATGLTVSCYGHDKATSYIHRRKIVAGDSGNPTFAIYPAGGNGLVLLSTHHTGGDGAAGPNLAHPSVQGPLRDALAGLILRHTSSSVIN